MKYILLLSLSFCLSRNALPQVTGTVINTNGQQVASANVFLLKNSDSSLIKVSLTNENGTFIIENIPAGNYLINITAVGDKEMFSPSFKLTAQQPHKDFDTLVLETVIKELKEVVVRQEKPLLQQKPEGIIVNVENSILTKGSSVLQVLERSPGVFINRRDNSIELNGKSGVMVMLNGKLIRMSESEVLDLLNGMSGDDIATIELLTSPSAKYDAEGSAGLINIVLKQNKHKGTSGSVNVSAGYGYREKATAGFNLSSNAAHVNLYTSYNFSHDRSYNNMFVDSWQDMPFLGGNIHALGWDTTYMVNDNHNATLGIDIKINPQTTIGSSIIFSSNKSSGIGYTHIGYDVLPDSLLQYDGWSRGMSQWNNVVSSVYAERLLKKSAKLNMNFDYLYFHHNAPYNVEGTFVNKHGEEAGNEQSLSAPAQKGFAKTVIRVFVGKIDYTTPLSKQMQLEAGIKTDFTQSSSYAGFESLINGDWTGNPQAVNNITMKEGIGAAYASVTTQINTSTSLITGLRFEYASTGMNDTKTSRQIVDRRLGSLFPNVFLSKKINEHSEMQLSYTKRITRPSYNDLASYVGYGDPTAVYTGNPFLQPTLTHNIKLGYNYKNYFFSLLFSRDENAIARYQLTESPNHDMLIISPQNISWQNNLTFQTTLPFKVNDWWTMNYSFVGGLHQYRIEYTKQPFEYSYFGYSFDYSNSFKMPCYFSAELSGNYNDRNYNGTQKVGGILRLNIGLKKELQNNKGSFQFSVTDVLRKEQYDINYGTLTQEAFSIRSHVIFSTESSRVPVFRLTYSRSFGSTKTKGLKANVSADEQGRIQKE